MTHRTGTVAPAVALIIAVSFLVGACTSAPAEQTTARASSDAAALSSPSPTGADATALDASPSAGETAEVRLEDSAFHPEELTIAAGTEVMFVSGDDYAHTVTQGSDGRASDDPFVDEDLMAQPVTVAFDEPGTFQLTCRLHPTMNMTITVEG